MNLERSGRLLFRLRGLIGAAGFLVVYYFSRATLYTCLAGLPLLLAGLFLRGWAMGYIGGDARAGKVGGESYICAGPYRWFKLNRNSPAGHPLYFGNLLLVAGTLVCLWPPVALAGVVLLLFVFEYLIIVRAEERYLANRFGGRVVRTVRFSRARLKPEWRTVVTVMVVFGLALLRALVW